ncbi:MAG TPA: hypothetical protein V6D20_04810 [Candidatus Obscuribacterales bacterium]
MSTVAPFIIHLRPERNGQVAPNGGATVAIELLDKFHVRYAVAKCHPKDNFIKRVGRDKASGRLKSEKFSHSLELFAPVERTQDALGELMPIIESELLVDSPDYM